MVLVLGWSHFWGSLISRLVLFLVWASNFWCGIISSVVFWGDLISGPGIWGSPIFSLILFLGWSYFWVGLISRVALFLE